MKIELDALKVAANTLGAVIQRTRAEVKMKTSLREKEILLKEIHLLLISQKLIWPNMLRI